MIQIPVYMPTFDDKIRVTLFHQETGNFIFKGDEKPLANVPEFPTA